MQIAARLWGMLCLFWGGLGAGSYDICPYPGAAHAGPCIANVPTAPPAAESKRTSRAVLCR